jgi:hypothetical protein
MALPVALSHTIEVSRWLVMPMAAMSFMVAPEMMRISLMTSTTLTQILSASCSTQPGFG